MAIKAQQCGHIVSAHSWSASCSDGVIRRLMLAPFLCDSCAIMREANGAEIPQGSNVIGFKWGEYSGQTPAWREELKKLDMVFALTLPHKTWYEPKQT
jgi:hypothetical protein